MVGSAGESRQSGPWKIESRLANSSSCSRWSRHCRQIFGADFEPSGDLFPAEAADKAQVAPVGFQDVRLPAERRLDAGAARARPAPVAQTYDFLRGLPAGDRLEDAPRGGAKLACRPAATDTSGLQLYIMCIIGT